RTMSAEFDPKTGHLKSMEQAGDFTFDEGERRARAAKATLDAQDVMYLETSASLSDASGATSADRIRIDQRTGNLTWEGGVRAGRSARQAAKEEELGDALGRRAAARPGREDGDHQRQSKGPLRRWRADVAGRQSDRSQHHRSRP